ncbi:AMP-binding protein [Rhizobium sp. VS19-DR104.2]|uniref:AMP-binding protein n=1 Tax=unclassified Rhizobium TaxID=2613769 RepID=UPI001CC76E38|nr:MULTISPECIES: AMP-binding protein [unclassified Rhizobium]MBZ5762235.1 AMP-binding protein [Rhizobium sp. VS19-DR96]MBZ5768251.1 AMP-binding protein [Rhizobium sp. VS19-DR129.2]MBZ5775877.1 AMP-binding protein [Rhizobium sp. VS19-DRK62.2]MBZ5787102.1 AMP-binding protein [Rhizobium sp. VS19-DR121]MBZ5804176.1 AMP-binding protein [Rhizobium sp. VS19-DR181]
MSGNLVHTLFDHRDPAALAYRFGDASPRTVGAFRKNIRKMASALVLSGVEPGDRISFKLEKSEEVLFLAQACLQIGAILHPLNTSYTDAEIGFLVSDATPKLFVCSSEDRTRFASLLDVPVLTLDRDLGGSLGDRTNSGVELPDVATKTSGDTAALLYTSGTTGRPKGACITHGNLAESAKALTAVWNIGATDTLLHPLPLYHAHGLLTSVNTMLVGGAFIHFIDGFQIDEVMRSLEVATILMGVPTHYARLTKDERLAQATRALRLVISGSAPLPSELASRFEAITGKAIIERYGATETAIVTAIPPGTTDRSGWVGWPLPGVSVRIDQNGQKRSGPAIGGLETRGHNVFSGYWRQPDADADAFTEDGWFVTGDIGEIDAQGCVRLLGRSKDLVISGGLNVYPKEVEDALGVLLDGREVAVFGAPHPDFGEAVVAAIEGVSPIPPEIELQTALRKTLAPYKVPKRIIAVGNIPRNRTGKVLKNELRDTHRDIFKSGTPTKK